MRRRSGIAVIALATVVVLAFFGTGRTAAARTAAGPYAPPFTQCPRIGEAPSCTLLIVFRPDGTSVQGDPSVGALGGPGNDDYLVGVQNDSTTAIQGVTLSSPDNLFRFEADQSGLCAYITCTWPHPIGDEGPNTSFEVDDYMHGVVHFPAGLAPGASTYFDIEGGNIGFAAATPVFGQTATVDTKSGDVCYFKPGSSAARLADCQQVNDQTAIGVGSVIDTTNGQATLKTSEGTTVVSGGRFRLNEKKATGPGSRGKHVAVFTLLANRKICPSVRTQAGTRASASATKTKPKPKVVARLFVKGKGHFQTKGSYASGTVRGTSWLTEELCNGTLIHVFTGVVTVYDLVLKKSVSVTAGHSYIAYAPTK